MQKITVRVPASTSNLGPGFDCLGLALRIYNDVTIARGSRGSVPAIAHAAAKAFFAAAAIKPFRFSCTIRDAVPVCRGLGSSVTLRLGTLMGLNRLTHRRFTGAQLFRICAELEGHPDNAAPAVFGGFTVVAGDRIQTFRVSSKLHVVLLVPSFEIETARARRLLPQEIAHSEAVRNGAHVAQIVAAFATASYDQLRGAFVDHVHQPFRKQLVPHFDEIIAAAESAGALGAFLSGSGSTIAALTLRSPNEIGVAMHDAARDRHANTIITSAENRGARIFA